MKQETQPFPRSGNLSSERGNPALPRAGRLHFLILRETAFLLGWGVLLLIFLTLLIGFFGGWFLARKIKLYLLRISSRDRVLIFAPHPDDETLAVGGLIS